MNINLENKKDKLESKKIISYCPNKDNQPLIKLENITKSYNNNKKIILDNLSLTIYDNENIALIGANGAGKTTLVEIICGIIKPNKGKISYLYDYNYSFQEKIGIQFQDSSYPAGLTVKNIVEFIANIYNVNLSKKQILEIIDAFGLTKLYNIQAKKLSGGQQQRLNILLSLIHKPKIVFFDELSTGLDISIKTRIKEFIYLWCKQNNINIVLVSHNMDEIELICDRIIILQNGEIKVDILKKDLLKEYSSIEELAKKYI